MPSVSIAEGAAPATPNSGVVVVYAKSDGLLYFKDDTGAERILSTGRETLLADRTYYVRTDGSNSNTGLANTAGGAFLTIQKAIDVVSSTLDINGYTVTIQIADGTYAGENVLKPVVGAGSPVPGTASANYGLVKIVGNATTPANVVITATGVSCFLSNGYVCKTPWRIESVRVATAFCGIWAQDTGVVTYSNIDFGSSLTYGLLAFNNAVIRAVGNFGISASMTGFAIAQQGGAVHIAGFTITATNTPAFSDAFVKAIYGGIVIMVGNTYTGSATGTRYTAVYNGGVRADGASGNFLGNAAGTTSTGGWVS